MTTTTTDRWTRKGEWSEVEISRAKTGYVVRFTSRIQGERTGRDVLVPYSVDCFDAGADLDRRWNAHMVLGEAIISEAKAAGLGSPYCTARLLRRGEVVR